MFQRKAHQQVVKTDSITDCTLAKELSALPFVTYLDDVELSDGLLSGTISAAIIFACSDMGLQLPYVCSSSAARVFVFQKFGHRFSDGEGAEFILRANVSDVIVYGHSSCDLVNFLIRCEHNPQEKELISKYLGYEHAVQMRNYADTLAPDDREQWLKIGRRNVLNDLKAMLVHPVICDQASKGRLRLHGWLYDSDKKALEIFEPEKNRFVSAMNRSSMHTAKR